MKKKGDQELEIISTMTERVLLMDPPRTLFEVVFQEEAPVRQLRQQFGVGKLNYKFTSQRGTNLREQDEQLVKKFKNLEKVRIKQKLIFLKLCIC